MKTLFLSILISFCFVTVCHSSQFIYVAKRTYQVKWVNYNRMIPFDKIIEKNPKADIIISGTFFDINTGKVAYAPFGRNLEGFIGVTLVENGSICFHPKQQGFRTLDTTSSVKRLGIGIKEGNWVIYEETCPLYWFALRMWSLGCRDAVALDGGSSVGMYDKSKGIVIHPGRRIANVYIFIKR